MIARAFPYDRPCRFQKFEATETIVTTGTTIWKPGFMFRDNFFVCGNSGQAVCPVKFSFCDGTASKFFSQKMKLMIIKRLKKVVLIHWLKFQTLKLPERLA